MKLLLFDIDGTILLTHGIGRRAVEASLSELSGRRIDIIGILFSGKTDPQIIREVLAASGFNGASLNGLVEEGLEAYTELMRESIRPEATELLGGVRELIEELALRDDVQLSLLTGNLEIGRAHV